MAKFWKQNWFKAGVALVGAKLAPDKALKATALSVPNVLALVSQ